MNMNNLTFKCVDEGCLTKRRVQWGDLIAYMEKIAILVPRNNGNGFLWSDLRRKKMQ